MHRQLLKLALPSLLFTGCYGGERLRGVCLDPLGKPIAKADIRVHITSSGKTKTSTTTRLTSGSDGRFAIVVPERFSSVDLEVVAPGYMKVRLSPSRDELDESVRIEMVPAGVLRGRAVDAAGQPVRDTEVWFDNGLTGGYASTGADGRFESSLPLGLWVVVVRGATFGVTLAATTPPLELVCEQNTRQISGQIVCGDDTQRLKPTLNAIGTSPSGMRICAVELADDGRFTVTPSSSSAAGPVTLTAHADGHASTSLRDLAWGTRNLAIHLAPTKQTTFVLVAADTGEPLADVEVSFAREDGTHLALSFTDEQGTCTAELPEGDVMISTENSAAHMLAKPVRVALPTANTEPVRMPLPRAHALDVVVTSVDGRLVADMTLELRGKTDDGESLPKQTAKTSSAGNATLWTEPGVTYELSGTHPEFTFHKAGISCAADTELPITIDVGARVSGRLVPTTAVSELSRQLGRRTLTVAVPTDAGRQQVKVDTEGQFTLPYLRNGRHDLRLEHPDSHGITLATLEVVGGKLVGGGATRDFAIDHLLAAPFHAEVQIAGQPYTGTCWLSGEIGAGAAMSRVGARGFAVAGQLRMRLIPGRWWVNLFACEQGPTPAASWLRTAPVQIARERENRVSFSVEPVDVTLRMRAEGRAEQPLFGAFDEGIGTVLGNWCNRIVAAPLTGEDQRALFEAGRQTLRIWPRHATSSRGLTRILEQPAANRMAALAPIVIDVPRQSPAMLEIDVTAALGR